MTSYSWRHGRVYQSRGKASQYKCETCPSQAREWAQLHNRDGEDPDDYVPLCKPCHIEYDENTTKGQVRTPEQRKHMSEAHKGIKQSAESIRKKSDALKGKPWSEARKFAEAGRKVNPDDRRRTVR